MSLLNKSWWEKDLISLVAKEGRQLLLVLVIFCCCCCLILLIKFELYWKPCFGLLVMKKMGESFQGDVDVGFGGEITVHIVGKTS